MAELIPQLNARLDGSEPTEPPDGAPGPYAGLQVALSRVTHDINNPLTIISGNAQLLVELSRALGLDPDVAKPIQDIEEASQQLANMVERLNALNEAAQQDGPGGDGVQG